MKKKLLILAVAGLALAACSSDETVASQATSEANAISFRPLMNNVTRATPLVPQDLSSSEGFFVTATFTTDGGSLYFSDKQYKKKTVDPYNWAPWNNSTSSFYTIYWPNTTADVLDFHAYARHQTKSSQLSVDNTYVSSENGCPRYTVTPAAEAANQIDFVYATLVNQDYQNTNMELTFGHKESQVGVKLYNSDNELKFTVSEVSICNIVSSGTFKNRDNSPATTTTMGWGDFDFENLTNYSQTGLNIQHYNQTVAADAGTTWILIPHTLAKPVNDGQYVSAETNEVYGGAYIKVKYKCQSNINQDIYYAGGSSSWVEGIWPISDNINTTTWVAGTHYTYTIDLAGGGYYERNQATPSGATLDRILNLNPITFATVTVSGWGDPSNTNVNM